MSKGCANNCQELLAEMMYWDKMNGIEIDTAVFFFNLEIEDMVNTKFNPGGPGAINEGAEIDISPLMVIPRTTREIEESIWREEAAAESQGTRTQSESPKMKKVDPRRPPRNWYELKEMLATFAALLWVFFGDVCPLYDQVLKI